MRCYVPSVNVADAPIRVHRSPFPSKFVHDVRCDPDVLGAVNLEHSAQTRLANVESL